MANEVIKSNVPASLLPNLPIIDFGKITAPEYVHNIVGIVERALQNPESYITLPRVLDFLLFEQVMKDKPFDENTYKSIFGKYLFEEKLKAARNILIFVHDTCSINFSYLWAKNQTNQTTQIKIEGTEWFFIRK